MQGCRPAAASARVRHSATMALPLSRRLAATSDGRCAKSALTEQAPNTGSADLQIGGCAVRGAVIYTGVDHSHSGHVEAHACSHEDVSDEEHLRCHVRYTYSCCASHTDTWGCSMGTQGRNPALHTGGADRLQGCMATRRALTSQSRTAVGREPSEGKTINCRHGRHGAGAHMGHAAAVITRGCSQDGSAGLQHGSERGGGTHHRGLYGVVDGGHAYEVDVAAHARAAVREDAAARPEGRHAPGY